MGYWSVERHPIGRKVWLIVIGVSAAFFVTLTVILISIYSSIARPMKAEAARAVQLHPDLAAEIGDHPHFGFVWQMSVQSNGESGGRAQAYVSVSGSRSSGTLYIEDWNGKLRTVRYRPKGEQGWKDF